MDAQWLAAFIRQQNQLSCCQLGLHVVVAAVGIKGAVEADRGDDDRR
jgi:hypothetical protein